MSTADLCPEAELTLILQKCGGDSLAGLTHVDRLLERYRADPRLNFLRGSLLADLQRYDEAQEAMKTALDHAPDYAVARFQLGLLQLTSGQTADALASWGPLALLPETHYLSRFVAGLHYMIRDEFDKSIVALRAGMDVNQELPALNRDMSMLIDEMGKKIAGGEDQTTSSTHFLLRQMRGGSALN